MQVFGDRMRTDRVERKLYSRDVGSLPKLRPTLDADGRCGHRGAAGLGGGGRRAARGGSQRRRACGARGMSTSGYGGVLPVPGAIVADMSAMDRVLSVDPEAMTVRVQAGVLWEPLQKTLNRQGLDLRMYPSSFPSSSVGGWLAQGGAGFGSYEYGFFKENVLTARASSLMARSRSSRAVTLTRSSRTPRGSLASSRR